MLLHLKSLVVAGIYALTCQYHLVSVSAANANRTQSARPSLQGYPFGRFAPGFNAFEREALGLSKPPANLSAQASALPLHRAASNLTSFQGCIKVKLASDNTTLGYLRNTYQGLNGLTNNEVEMLFVKFHLPASSLAPFNIIAQDPKFPGPTNLGGSIVFGSASQGLSVNPIDHDNLIILNNVQQTEPGSRPVLTFRGFVQSAIWMMDKSTLELKAHWISHNGRSPPTNITLDRRSNTLYLNSVTTVSPDMVVVLFSLNPSCRKIASSQM